MKPSLPPSVLFATALALTLAVGVVSTTSCSRTGDSAQAGEDHADPHAGHAHAGGSPHAAAIPAGQQCTEHGVPEAECGICHPERLAGLKAGESLKVRLPAPDSASLSGVVVDAPVPGSASDAVECFAEITFDQNRYARVAAPVGGILREVSADLGALVREQEPVARIWSATLSEAVAKAVLSHQTLDRERRLRANRVTSEQSLQQAEADHRAACQHLRTLGFTEEQVDQFASMPQEPVLLEVRAPFAGEVIERTAVRGGSVEPGQALFTLADRSTMWAMLHFPESGLASLKPGQDVDLRVDSLPGRKFPGRITWISAEVDERTRMARARAEIPNPDGLLRARMFGHARILTGRRDGALLVPTRALQWIEGRPLLFVRLADDLFEARAVRTGARGEGQVEIVEGLLPTDRVVVDRGFPLKSALLISRLGAGCADD